MAQSRFGGQVISVQSPAGSATAQPAGPIMPPEASGQQDMSMVEGMQQPGGETLAPPSFMVGEQGQPEKPTVPSFAPRAQAARQSRFGGTVINDIRLPAVNPAVMAQLPDSIKPQPVQDESLMRDAAFLGRSAIVGGISVADLPRMAVGGIGKGMIGLTYLSTLPARVLGFDTSAADDMLKTWDKANTETWMENGYAERAAADIDALTNNQLQPRTAGERIIDTATQFAASGLGPSAVLRGAGKAANALEQAGRASEITATQRAGQFLSYQSLKDVAAAAGAGAAQQGAQEAGLGPVAQILAPFVGGVAGYAAGAGAQAAGRSISNPSQLLLKAARVSPEQLAKDIDMDVMNAAEATGVRLTPDAATKTAVAQTMMQKLNSMAITQDHFRSMMDEVDTSFLKSYDTQLSTLSKDTFASADEAVQKLKPTIETAESAAEARANALYQQADMFLPPEATHLPSNTIEYLKKSLTKLDESLLPSRDELAVRQAFSKLSESIGTNKVTEGIKTALRDLDASIAKQTSELNRTRSTDIAADIEKSIGKSQSLKDTLTALQPILNDQQFMQGGIRTITDANGVPVMQIDPMLARQEAPKVKQLTATIRSLNQTIAWDDEVRGVKRLLEGAKSALKSDLEEYGQKNPQWFGSWKKANEVFGQEVGDRFRTGVVRSMITGEKPVAILNMLNSTSAVKALEEAIGGTDAGAEVLKSIKRFKLEEILGKRLQNATTEEVQFGQYAAAMNPAKKEQVSLIRALAGEQYTQLENLATVARALAESYARYGNPSRTGNRMMDMLFPQDGWAQAGQAILTYATGGLWGLAGYGVMQATPRMMAKQLTDPKYIKLMKEAMTAQVKHDPSATTRTMRELTYWYRDTMKELGEGPIMRFSDDFKQEYMKARGERKQGGMKLYSGLPIQDVVELTEDVVRAGYKALKPGDVVIDDMANTDIGGGFASTIGKALNASKTRKATGRQWKVELEKAGARPEELEFTHVGPFLEQNGDKVIGRSAVKQMVEFSKPNVQLVGLAERQRMVNPEYVAQKQKIKDARLKVREDYFAEYADALGVKNAYDEVVAEYGGFANFGGDLVYDRALRKERVLKAADNHDVDREVLYKVVTRAQGEEFPWDAGENSVLRSVSSDLNADGNKTPQSQEAAKKVQALMKKYAEKDMIASSEGSMRQEMDVKPNGLDIKGRAEYGSYTAQKDHNLYENKYEMLVKFPEQDMEADPNGIYNFMQEMGKKYGDRGGLVPDHMTPDEKLTYDFMQQSTKKRRELSFEYQAPHFSGNSKNLLAHARVNVTPDADGNRVLVIDEVQSDLHNVGRDEGYFAKDERPGTSGADEFAQERMQARIDELESERADLENGFDYEEISAAEEKVNEAYDALEKANDEFFQWQLENFYPSMKPYGVEPPVDRFGGFLTIKNIDKVPEQLQRQLDVMNMEARKKIVRPADEAHSQALFDLSELEKKQERIAEITDEIDNMNIEDFVHGMDDTDVNTKAPAEAPLRNTWSEMLVRRAVKFAVDNGIDKVGITSGREQAARWNLGQWVRNVVVMPKAKIDLAAADGFVRDTEKVLVQVNSKSGERMNLSALGGNVKGEKFGAFYAVSRNDLPAIFGKARAEKMIAEADAMWPKVEEAYAERKDMPFSNISEDGGEAKVYNFSQLKEYVQDQKAMFDKAYAGENQKSISGGHDYHLNQIEQQFMTTLQPKAAGIIDDSNFMLGGEGRVKAYDEILMRAVNKLLRKYGGEDATREAVPTRLPEKVYTGTQEQNPFIRGNFTGENATPQVVDALKKLGIDVNLEDLAQHKTGNIVKAAGVDPEHTAETWTFRIPEKLKEEYRNSGVPFFAIPALVGVGMAAGNEQQ